VKVLDLMADLDDRFWVKRQRWVRAAGVVAFGLTVIARVLVLLGYTVGLMEFGLALLAGVGAVLLVAWVSGWAAKRRHTTPVP
jgi:hypothetical protein